MAYGEIKIDTITFTAGGVDTSVSVSGLVQNPTFTGGITTTGTLQADTVIGTTLVSGSTASFTGTLTAESGVFASGVEASPSVSIGTPDNGLYSPSTDEVAISTNGTGRLFIDSSGKVGLGTSSPAVPLHIRSTEPEIYLQDSDAGDSRSNIRYNAGVLTIGADDTNAISASSLRLRVDGNEYMRIDDQGRVGIGSTAPGDYGANLAVANTSGNSIISVAASTSGVSGINFADGTASAAARAAGFIQHQHSNNSLNFGIADDTKITLDSSGRLLVGTSSASANVSAVFQANSASSTGAGVVQISRGQTFSAADTNIANVEFTDSSGNVFGRINCTSDGAVTAGTDHPGRLVFSTTPDGDNSPDEVMRITSDKYVRLASGTGGIQFNGDTAAANALDDYEEGTWTPVFGGFSSITYTAQTGIYTKIGKIVRVQGRIAYSARTASGNVYISGLPFNRNQTITNNGTSIRIYVGGGTKTHAPVYLTTNNYYPAATNTTTASTDPFGATANIYFDMTYISN